MCLRKSSKDPLPQYTISQISKDKWLNSPLISILWIHFLISISELVSTSWMCSKNKQSQNHRSQINMGKWWLTSPLSSKLWINVYIPISECGPPSYFMHVMAWFSRMCSKNQRKSQICIGKWFTSPEYVPTRKIKVRVVQLLKITILSTRHAIIITIP